ncbi:MAG TPA: signal recognition particle protein [Pirellulaceae bacterium]|jgi:signal recognition particle subunit SRP54|nr:signal recognition particle protein [Pirellulaceae bacterium]
MFESLRDNLHSAVKSLRGKGKLTEANMREGLKLVEQSLIEADVSYDAVKAFMGRVTEKSTGQKVLLALDPAQQVVGIVHDELVSLLGPVDSSLHLKKGLTVIMLCGLQGSGKTTTSGKLAKLLLENKFKPMLVAADVKRPAAIDQLHVIGEQLGVPVYSERGRTDEETSRLDPVKVCQNGVAQAKKQAVDVVILDTAGRLAIDEELMNQLRKIDDRVQPDQAYLVVDGMTGQDAVNSAKAFHDALELDGFIMTKLDGDARGGALLSVKHVTGVPIKFIGTGEKLDALEPFTPEGMAGRILGLGDIRQLVAEVRKVVDEKEQKELEDRMARGIFTLEDFRDQMMKIAKPGLMQKMMSLMPGMGQMAEMMANADTSKDVKRMIGMIDSMTQEERRNPKVIDPSRRNRIAKGAGVQVSELNGLLKQFEVMKPLMTMMAGKEGGDRMKMMQDIQKSGLLNPGGQMPRLKKGTGKRLSPKEKEQARKEREKALKKMKKDRK